MAVPPNYEKINKKAFIFDMDGTIVDNMKYHVKAWVEFLNKMGIQKQYDEVYKGLSQSAREYLKGIFDRKVDDAYIIHLEKEKEQLYRQIYKKEITEVKGFTTLLKLLKNASKKIGLATLGNNDNVVFTLNALRITNYFDDIKRCEDVIHGKPHPEIYLKSLASMGVQPEDAIVFEDSQFGILAAKASGIEVIGVESMHSSDELRSWGAIDTIIHFEDLLSRYELT